MIPVLTNTLFVFLSVLLFFGGLGEYASVFLIIFILFILFFKLKFADKFKNFKFPPRSGIYILFLLFFLLSFLWSKNLSLSFISFFLFFSGYIFWAMAFNLKEKVKSMDTAIIYLGLIFGLMSLIFLGSSETSTLSLVRFAIASHHHHIGDYWAVVLIILGWRYSKKSSNIKIFLILLGICFLFISLSRSAYTALSVGSLFLILKKDILHKRIFWLYIMVSVILFLYASTQKSTISSHAGYLIQGVIGSLRYPFGIGVGNFEYLSANTQNTLFGLKGATTSAHNIFLEITSGVGILGLSFIAWFVMVIKDMFKKTIGKRVLYAAIFITLSVNFLFDYTYLIPTMLWIWFISLGLSQARFRLK